MTDWKPPIFELGEVEAVAPDGTEGVCYDEAIIFFKDHEGECSIDIECPAALRLASYIVKAVNGHDALVKALEEIAVLSIHSYRAGEIARKALALVGSAREGS
jgi:hypothetical protein